MPPPTTATVGGMRDLGRAGQRGREAVLSARTPTPPAPVPPARTSPGARAEKAPPLLRE